MYSKSGVHAGFISHQPYIDPALGEVVSEEQNLFINALHCIDNRKVFFASLGFPILY